MKLGEIVVHMDNYNFTKFHQNQMKNKKVLLIARFSVQNFKVSVESWKSYIVYVIRHKISYLSKYERPKNGATPSTYTKNPKEIPHIPWINAPRL